MSCIVLLVEDNAVKAEHISNSSHDNKISGIRKIFLNTNLSTKLNNRLNYNINKKIVLERFVLKTKKLVFRVETLIFKKH